MSATTYPEPKIFPLAGERQLVELLSGIEDTYEAQRGEHLKSEEFYGRYQRGEIDNPFAMAWATYYEALLDLREADVGAALRVVETLAIA